MSETDDSSGSGGSGAKTRTYRDAGVDIDAGNALVRAIKPLVKATGRPGADGDIGGFGGVFDLKAAGFEDPLLVACNDGVGTKLKIAIETGRHERIGVDLVAMCVNDLVVQGAEPLFFLDYYATGALDVEAARDVVAGIAAGCRESGCALIGGETAEMPGMYAKGDYDLAGFAVGAVERGDLLPARNIAAGDKLVALPSSGVHSNGYSLVRTLVATKGLAWTAPAPWAADRDLASELLEPTRIYVKPVLATLKACGGGGASIRALAHITGGGLSENIPRVLPNGMQAHVDLGSWQLPGVFNWLKEAGNLPTEELLRTFNCGIGMVLVVAAEKTDHVISALQDAGEAPHVIGEIAVNSEKAGQDEPSVVYSGRLEAAA